MKPLCRPKPSDARSFATPVSTPSPLPVRLQGNDVGRADGPLRHVHHGVLVDEPVEDPFRGVPLLAWGGAESLDEPLVMQLVMQAMKKDPDPVGIQGLLPAKTVARSAGFEPATS